MMRRRNHLKKMKIVVASYSSYLSFCELLLYSTATMRVKGEEFEVEKDVFVQEGSKVVESHQQKKES